MYAKKKRMVNFKNITLSILILDNIIVRIPIGKDNIKNLNMLIPIFSKSNCFIIDIGFNNDIPISPEPINRPICSLILVGYMFDNN